MNNFSYSRAETLEKAFNDIKPGGAKFIAGGTNLIDLMKENVVQPTHLVDLNPLPLKTIEEQNGGGLRLGALCTNAETAYHPLVQEKYPLLSLAILNGASAQLRNMATNGGNLLQRTRCYYFYDTAMPCNKRDPNSGCGAIEGYNRIHAVLGTSESCIATHPSDMCIALAALDATVNVAGANGERSINFADFHRLPENTPEKDNNLEAGEIITSIDLPAEDFSKNYTYLKIRDRASYAFALVSAAVCLEIEGDKIKTARIALGGVAHKPWRDTEAENLLAGKSSTRENFRKAAEKIFADAKGFGANSFKIELGKLTVVRALEQAAAGTPQPVADKEIK